MRPHLGKNVRTLGNHRHVRARLQRGRERLEGRFHRCIRLSPQAGMISGGKSWNIPEKTLPRGDQSQFFQLPLIDRYRSALDALQKLVVGYAFA